MFDFASAGKAESGLLLEHRPLVGTTAGGSSGSNGDGHDRHDDNGHVHANVNDEEVIARAAQVISNAHAHLNGDAHIHKRSRDLTASRLKGLATEERRIIA